MLKHLKSSQDWNEKRAGAKGFTLIELIVVIIILGVLAAVTIFAVGSIRERADASDCENEVGRVERAIAAHVEAHGGMPTFPGGEDDPLTPNDLEKLRKKTLYITVGDIIVAQGSNQGTVKTGTCGEDEDEG